MAAPHLISEEKRALREAARARREGCRPELGVWLAARVLGAGLVPAGAVVAGTWPLGSEIDMRPLLLALLGRGHAVLLPETGARGEALRFRRWRPGVPMVRERFGTLRPEGPEGEPDVVLVPLLAFDAGCRRLGYGGGYYDRTLAARPGLRAVGCAYAAQQVDAVPAMAHDAVLDAVATDAGVVFGPEG